MRHSGIGLLNRHLAGFKKPKYVEFAEALPRNAALKVVKGELRNKFGKSVRYE